MCKQYNEIGQLHVITQLDAVDYITDMRKQQEMHLKSHIMPYYILSNKYHLRI